MLKTCTHIFVPRKVTINKVRPLVKYRERVKTNISHVSFDWENTCFYVGKGIVLFTMFYCSMNWLLYKRIREKIEEDNKQR